MIVTHHYPRRGKRRANVPVVVGDAFYVPRHRACTRASDVITIHYPEVPTRVGTLLAWQCLSCGRVEVA